MCEKLSSSDCAVAEVDGSGTGVCPADAGYEFRAWKFSMQMPIKFILYNWNYVNQVFSVFIIL